MQLSSPFDEILKKKKEEEKEKMKKKRKSKKEKEKKMKKKKKKKRGEKKLTRLEDLYSFNFVVVYRTRHSLF